jgi:hypothetical protein
MSSLRGRFSAGILGPDALYCPQNHENHGPYKQEPADRAQSDAKRMSTRRRCFVAKIMRYAAHQGAEQPEAHYSRDAWLVYRLHNPRGIRVVKG